MEQTDHSPIAQSIRPYILTEHGSGLVRALWTGMAALTLSIFLVSLPAYILDLNEPIDWAALEKPAQPIFALALLRTCLSIAVVLSCFILASILYRHRRDDWIALYASFLLLFYAVASAGPIERLSVYDPALERVGQSIVFFAAVPWIIFFSLFPSGRFVPPWSKWLSIAAFPWALVLAVFHPFSRFARGPLPPLFEFVWTMSLAPLMVYAQVWRYRHLSNTVERQQTKWIIFGLFVAMTLFTVSTIPWVYVNNQPEGSIGVEWANWVMLFLEVIWVMMLCVTPLAMSVAVLRYRLWDINLIIQRTLLYTLLTALVVSIYVATVGSLSAVFQTRGNFLISLLTTGIVAVLFQPLRERLQHWISRWLYGERDDPYMVLTQLGQRLEKALVPTDILPILVQTVARALKLPYVAVALKQGDLFKTASEYGLAPAWAEAPGEKKNDFLVLPLIYQAAVIGQLTLSPRTPNDPFTPPERVLLEDIARQVGVAAHAVRLTADLQQSRERLVTTREEERRRLRRDLHDGLGPALAATSFKLDAATNLVRYDPEKSQTLIAEIKAQIQTFLAEIRRIAYDLRPPALDELGLVGALREHIASRQAQGLHITLDAPAMLPLLAAAVEVAAYRIALEALNNVYRHAQAQRCVVRLSLCDNLCLEISDDGRGIPDHVRAGVGMLSMRERAEELGGICVFENYPEQGTRVYVQLPLMTTSYQKEAAWRQSES